MKKDKEFMKLIPPCNACNLCEYRLRGSGNCEIHVMRHSDGVSELIFQQLWAIAQMWNCVFREYGKDDGWSPDAEKRGDSSSLVVCRMRKAEVMIKWQEKAKSILRCRDIGKLKKMREDFDRLYFGNESEVKG